MKNRRKNSLFLQNQSVVVEALESRALLSASVALSLHGQFFETSPRQMATSVQLSANEGSTGAFTGTLAASGFRTYYVSGTLSGDLISFKVDKTATGSRVGEFTGSVRSSGELIGALAFTVGSTPYMGSLHLNSAESGVVTPGTSSGSTATGSSSAATGTTTATNTTGTATTTPVTGTTTTTTVTTTTGNTAIGTITGTTVVGETGTGGTGTGISDTGAGTGTGISETGTGTGVTDTGAGTGTGISDTNTGTGISGTGAGTGTGISDGNGSVGTTPTIIAPTPTTGTGTTTTGSDNTPSEPTTPGSGGIVLRSFSETPITFAD